MSYISAVQMGDDIMVWERGDDGERTVITHRAPYYFYVDDDAGEYTTIYGTRVSKISFPTQLRFRAAVKKNRDQGIRVWESDIEPRVRVLSSEYFERPVPNLHTTFFDIEVDYDPKRGFSSPINPYAPINSVSILHAWSKELVVIVVPPEEGWDEDRLRDAVTSAVPDVPVPAEFALRYVMCKDERELLINLIYEFEDSDVICGWNSDFFDVPYVAQRILRVLDNIELDLSVIQTPGLNPKDKVECKWNNDPNPIAKRCKWLRKLDFDLYGLPEFRIVSSRESGRLLGVTCDLRGRIRADYMNLYKKFEQGDRQSYKLSAISDIVLVDDDTDKPLLPKLEYEGSLADLYRNNFPFFVRYNIRDTEILYGFEKKLGYVNLSNEIYHLSTGLFSHITGTIKLAELALINYCHHKLKKVVNNFEKSQEDRKIDGALVLLPQIGLHEEFGSIDINSLYPSAIRSLNISPETLRGQFVNCFDDAAEVAKNSNKMISFIFEDTGELDTRPACDWRTYFLGKKWAISGYGTAFDQTTQGFIPALLAGWYDMRKEYQALQRKAIQANDSETAAYYDRLQYVYKIKLNSAYGALTNLYFRFFDLRMGESTTATGRVILKHQCRKVSEILEGNYDVDFPLYENIEDATDEKVGYTLEEANKICLNGPVFNGQFQSDAVIYGDTDSTYFKTYTTDPTEVIQVADAVAAQVNDSYQQFMRDTFLCTAGFDNIIKCGREIISDKGIFVEKKRYILHITNLNGKAVDKMKVMGLDTKKTTLPAEVSKEINKFIERYLKGESWELISQSIVDYKTELLNSKNITVIGLPKGVNGIEQYTKAYSIDVNARLPGHVAAAIYYNECLEAYGDRVSMPIMSGMKIKVFYLIGKHGKFKSIALPTDIEVVPQWFLDNFKVDTKAHIKRLVDNPLENILKAIGKKSPTKQSMTREAIFGF